MAPHCCHEPHDKGPQVSLHTPRALTLSGRPALVLEQFRFTVVAGRFCTLWVFYPRFLRIPGWSRLKAVV